MEVTATDREVDVTNLESMRAALRTGPPDALVHLAAQSSVAASWKDPLGAFRLNYLGSLTVLSAVEAEAPHARVLLIGSSDAYGNPRSQPGRPIRESDPLHPESPYARSKAAAEQLGAVAVARGLDVVRVRAFTHIGAGQTDRFVASSFARQVAEIAGGVREPRLSVGNLDSVRDFLDVRDVVDAYCRLVEPGVPADVYNVASGHGVAIRELLDELLDLAGVSAKVEVDPELFRPSDFSVGDASRLRAATGWTPRFPLRETLGGLLDWWRGQIPAIPA
jgi:GDP-4-dehydro-6-deoxy-D-mannose reductase